MGAKITREHAVQRAIKKICETQLWTIGLKNINVDALDVIRCNKEVLQALHKLWDAATQVQRKLDKEKQHAQH